MTWADTGLGLVAEVGTMRRDGWLTPGLEQLAGMPHDPDAVTPVEPIVYERSDVHLDMRLDALLDELRQPCPDCATADTEAGCPNMRRCGNSGTLSGWPAHIIDTVQRATFSEDRTRVALDRRTGTGWRRVAEVDTPEGWPR